MIGGAGNDFLWGGYGHDEMYGNDGNDRLFGNGGADYLDGGASSRDELTGGAGADTFINYAPTWMSEDWMSNYDYVSDQIRTRDSNPSNNRNWAG